MDAEERALLDDLRSLGLDASSHRAVALLPLVEVAWADAAVQDEEREKILEVAKGHQLLEGNGARVLEGWLRERPSPEYFALGRSVFVRLAHRHHGLGADVPTALVEVVVFLCGVVAESAGGLFGMFFQVSQTEQEAIRRVATAIEAESARFSDGMGGPPADDGAKVWQDLLDELTEELPGSTRSGSAEERVPTTVFRAIKP